MPALKKGTNASGPGPSLQAALGLLMPSRIYITSEGIPARAVSCLG